MADLLWLVIALPLAGALFLHFAGRYVKEPLSGWLASAAIGGAFVIAAIAAVPFIQGGAEPITIPLWEWMPAIGASFELLWDPLAALMALVVTGVGTLIHVFAIGYMHGDERFHRFFTNLNLFAASMLTLVLAGNYAMLFLGWELVGLCSYLLIGFWYTRTTAAAAAKKAFIVNRIGDFGFMIGLMLIFAVFGTLSFAGVFERAGEELHRGDGYRDRAAPAGWRRGQVGADPALRLAARCDGGPDSCLRPDPCRDDGHRRGLRHRPVRPDLRVHTLRLDGGCNHGGADRDMGGLHRPGPDAMSRRSWPTRPSPSSASCSSPSGPGHMSPGCSIS